MRVRPATYDDSSSVLVDHSVEGAMYASVEAKMTVCASGFLVGRQREVPVLNDLVNRVDARGGALILRGQDGVDKSALLAAATYDAKRKGLEV
jgi:hypothetical protein